MKQPATFRNPSPLASMLLLLGLMFLSACGGGGVSISLSPTTATVAPGATQQFTASVSNGAGKGVTWQVNNIIGGNTTSGTIDANGLYTAPAVIPSSAAITITAVPNADTLKTATATVTVANVISVSPASAVVSVTATQQFAANVTFSTDTAVNWQVNGVAGGNSTVGTISSNGTYTAPGTVPSPPRITITAVAHADNSKTATASLLVTPPTIAISPSGITIVAGSQQGFVATVLQQTVTPSWSVQCQSANASDCGTISSDGIYSAPWAPPAGGNVTITASMANGAAQSTSLTIPIQIGTATLAGTYVFGLSNHSLTSFGAEVGTITFNGLGSITGGSLDRSNGGGSAIGITGGSYELGTDGRGTALLNTAEGSVAWQLAIGTHNRVFVARLSADGLNYSGTLDLQQSSATTPISGNYTFLLSGTSSGSAFSQAGTLTADGVSAISQTMSDTDVGSSLDPSVSGSGNFTVPSTLGRGTLSLSSAVGTQSLVYYAVDNSHLKVVETDGAQLAAGDLYQQSGGQYTLSSFNERLAFTLSGPTAASTYALGGVFRLDGNAGVTNRYLDGISQTVFDTPGVYLVTDASSGRTTLSWNSGTGTASQFVMYPAGAGRFAMMEFDGVHHASGWAFQQTLASPNTATMVGNQALVLSGSDVASASPAVFTGTALISQTGAWTGTLDYADSSGATLNAESQVGSFSVAANGRGVVTVLPTSPALNASTLIIYVLDANNALLFESDSNRILTGSLERQY